MTREQILVRDVCRRGGRRKARTACKERKLEKVRNRNEDELRGETTGREHSSSEGHGSCSSVKYRGRRYKMRYRKKMGARNTENMTQASCG